ncbi:MAG: DUF4345 family protein [Chloroflexi bacterium]|nr:DUF4345 family protein [Chloroflexota bacterium]
MLQILKIIAAVVTLATGVYSLLFPLAVRGFTGLEMPGPRGITEVRAVLGGAFIGLGLAALLLNAPEAYRTVGIMYLVVGAVRIVSMIIDRSAVQSNWISLAFEAVLGLILAL